MGKRNENTQRDRQEQKEKGRRDRRCVCVTKKSQTFITAFSRDGSEGKREMERECDPEKVRWSRILPANPCRVSENLATLPLR